MNVRKVVCDALILGGGIAGLTAAYILAKQKKRVVLVEKASTFGGAIFSYEFPAFTVEAYYHHFFPWDKDILWLIHELGLQQRIVWKEPLTVFYKNGKYYPLLKPLDIFTFTPLSLQGKIEFVRLMITIRMIKDPGTYDQVSVRDFIVRYGGKKVFHELFSFLIKSKFGTDGENISAAWFIERIQLRSNVGKSGEVLGYLHGGLYQLVSGITQKIIELGGTLLLEAYPGRIDCQQGITKVSIHGKKKRDIFPKYVISTIPPAVLGSLIPFQPEYQQLLAKTQYQPAICLLLGLKRQVTPGYYWTNLLMNDCAFGALIEQTQFISPENYGGMHLAYLASYVPQTSPLLTAPENELKEHYLSDLKRLFPHISQEDILWVRVGRLRTAGIIYTTGIKSSILPYETPVKNLFMGGLFNSYPERTIDTSIKIGRILAGKCF